MGPPMRKIRQAATRRRARESGAPVSERAAKVAREANTERASQEVDPARAEVGEAPSIQGVNEVQSVPTSLPHSLRAKGGCEELSPPSVPGRESNVEFLSELAEKATVEGARGEGRDEGAPETAEAEERAVRAPSPAKTTASAESEANTSSATAGPSEDTPHISLQSLLARHGRWAEKAAIRSYAPELQGALRHQGRATFFKEAYAAHLWAFNSLAAMRDLWSQAEAALDLSREEMSDLRIRAEKSEADLEEARAKVAQAQKAETEAKAARADDLRRAEKAKEELVGEREKASKAEEKQREIKKMLKEAESEVFMLRNRLHTATIEISAAEERAENAEEIARRADTNAIDLRAATTRAEERAAEAERKAAQAIDEFKKSEAFEDELAEATAFAYNGGFNECKEKVSKLYPNLVGIGDLEPDNVLDDDQ